MSSSGVNAPCAVEIGVPGLEAAVHFYEQVWELSVVERSAATCYLRAMDPDYHVGKDYHAEVQSGQAEGYFCKTKIQAS
jgi:hypothetical protein